MQYRFVSCALRALGLLFVVSSLLGCIGFVGPEVRAPATLGAYSIGVTTFTVHDSSRDRSLPVEVWYPAARPVIATEDEPVVYDVRGMGGTVARLRSPGRALRDVDASRDGGPFPVVLISHGAGSTRFGNVTLAEVLASRGYVVAAPDHVGHTIDDNLFGVDDADRAQSAHDRPRDLSRVLDALDARSSNPRFLLAGRVDMSRVAVAGHSFGALAALGMVGAQFDGERQREDCRIDASHRSCAAVPVFGAGLYRYRDPRVRAAILITPAGFDLYRAAGIAAVDAPALVIGARRDDTTPFDTFTKPTFDALSTPHYLLDLPTAGHLTPTDVCRVIDSVGFLAKAFGGARASDGCGGETEGYLSTAEANDRLARATLAFLELYLDADATAESRLAIALAPKTDPTGTPKNIASVASTPQ